ncbi:thiosulfate oxidation carrier protein SoxY [Hydrogenimonas sp.]
MERRGFLKGLAGACALTAAGVPGSAFAAGGKPKGPNEMPYKKALEAITKGKGAKDSDKVKLVVPEIAENGAVVPVKVTVDAPMEEKNYVKSIHILATKNANARCADVFLTPANGRAYFATRIKLGGTQEVVAVAQLGDGSFVKAHKSVKVTIGGCG